MAEGCEQRRSKCWAECVKMVDECQLKRLTMVNKNVKMPAKQSKAERPSQVQDGAELCDLARIAGGGLRAHVKLK